MKTAKKESGFANIHIGFCTAIVCVLLFATAPIYAALSPLHVEGNKIKDVDGHVVVLRGVSAPDIGELKKSFGITEYIDRLTNKDDTNSNSPGWYTKVIRYPTYPKGTDINSPIAFDPYDPCEPNNQALYEALKEAADYGAQKGVYSIICLDYHGDISTKVEECDAFWNYMAPRFADDGNVIFEIYGEPTNSANNWNVVQYYMQRKVNAARALAPNNIILVTGGCYGQDIELAVSSPVDGNNVAFAFHCYGLTWRSTDGEAWIRRNIDPVAIVYPIIVTTWGFEPNSDPCIYDTKWSCGSASDFGVPFLNYLEGLGVGGIACFGGFNWSPPMFDSNWQLLCGEYMGGFVKDWLYDKRNTERYSIMAVSKCKIAAGKTQGLDSDDIANIKDSFTLSGTFGNLPIDFSQTENIDVNITSPDGNVVYFESIDCNSSRIRNGAFGYKYKIPRYSAGAITALTIDPAKRKFAITAKNVDLTGLSCPVHLELAIGYYTLTGDINEAIVNGKKTLIPTRLMRMFDNKLVAARASAKHSTKPLSDSLSAKGDLAVADIDVNLCNEDVNIIWGEQLFNIPQGNFIASKTGHLYKCKKVIADTNDGDAGIVTAQIDIDKATFTVSVSAADSLDVTSNYIAFGVQFADFNEVTDVNRVTKRSY